jgi:serine/threonine protein kinase
MSSRDGTYTDLLLESNYNERTQNDLQRFHHRHIMNNGTQLVTSVRELRPLTEWFLTQDDGQQKLSRTTFGFVTDSYCSYFGQATVGKWELTTEMVNQCLERIPDEDIYPEAPPHITIAPTSTHGRSDVFVKGPNLRRYEDLKGTGIAAKLLLYEAEMLELLSRPSQHPNIIRYHGCIVERGRIVGLVLDRHALTLQQRLTADMDSFDQDDIGVFDEKSCISKIELAVEHIHSRGLAHNDLNPSNIMLRFGEPTEPIIIDFGSCQPLGNNLLSAGTPGWVDEDCHSTSALRNDEIALGRIRTWLTERSSELST